MDHAATPDVAHIRSLRTNYPNVRPRDLADVHGFPEAALVAAHLGLGVTALQPHPDQLMPLLGELGDVMALTRNRNCVHERKGVYKTYHSGSWAQMILSSEIDLRLFAKHWVHAYAVVEGEKRSIQVFDAAGDAVHKVHLIPASDIAAFDRLVAALAIPAGMPTFAPRQPVEGPRAVPAAAEALRKGWAAMTDSHQFLGLVKDHGMNRLGANRIAGAPHARAMQTGAVQAALDMAAFSEIPVMIFVGNAGCIQIHSGLIGKTVVMGPWINIMDPRFNLHLRGDKIAEVWHVTKPTATGPAVSIEAFDTEGELILQIFASRKDRTGDAWNALVEGLPHLEEVSA